MKTFRTLMMVVMMTIASYASALTYTEAREEALFLTDKITYELDLTAAQSDAVYEINLNYFMSVDHRGNIYGSNWKSRNRNMKYILDKWQYKAYCSTSYFYRPISWEYNTWHFSIYDRYTNRHKFYNSHPKAAKKGNRTFGNKKTSHDYKHFGGHR